MEENNYKLTGETLTLTHTHVLLKLWDRESSDFRALSVTPALPGGSRTRVKDPLGHALGGLVC